MAEEFQVTINPEIEPELCFSASSLSLHIYSSMVELMEIMMCSPLIAILLIMTRNIDYVKNGRRYHVYREGEYALPNDEEEQGRMDLLHNIYNLILDGEINVAPIKNPQRVLDIGEYFEIQSFTVDIFSDDGSIEKAPYTKQVVSLIQEASAKFGKPMDNLDTWPAAMKESGFTDVVCKIVKAPSSPWAKDPKQKEIGRFFQAH
ncbi:hypothetical protein ANOM_009688 [Aspergillus nomiae NRRL 13137]|uniref:Uncharacterized protein n=1 Tax=Aspergillus nomiae NRRL (strain ATCC 15546 / NRRL 13137 / CBS 260.88 / M93) TaxID=1509407 RepID=A0A0L1ITM0_ASPN3|nr:uncharacterized protein ANOM_009688 [Aspergillus nomiae NRRL 13137]KNG82513.1 hypothetical protein ANOM_009688 [Aspergillus nomiae NRRL 13137]